MKFRSAALFITACSLAVAGCGGGSEAPKADAAAAPSLEEAKAVVIDYFTKVFVGDSSACEHESATYAALHNGENDAEDCAARVESVKEGLTDGEPLLDVSKTVVAVSQGKGDTAVADVTHELEGLGATYHLVVVDGAWVIDSEEEVLAAEEAGVEPRTLSGEEADAVALSFCQVEPGVTRDDVETWMGTPDDESSESDELSVLRWFVNKDSYEVWVDSEYKVVTFSSNVPREVDLCES